MVAIRDAGPDVGRARDHRARPRLLRAPATLIDVDALRPGPQVRAVGVQMEHVRLLAAAPEAWPPLLVTPDRTIVDGLHRYHAARMLGLGTVACQVFDGDSDAAYIEFVQRNVRQGLPLTLREREHAVCRLLDLRPDWSDRRIAEVCGVAGGTVRRVRAFGDRPTAQRGGLDIRRGRDGRNRPVNATALRRVISEALTADPAASSRTIARRVGSSPTTVGRVRTEMALGMADRYAADAQELEPEVDPRPPSADAVVAGRAGSTAGARWVPPNSLSGSPEHAEFTEWFVGTWVADDEHRRAGAVPLGAVYELADEARRRADAWIEFARALEGRAAQSRRR